MVTRLVLRDLRLYVRLGCEADERVKPQAVDVTVEMRFAQTPEACHTDRLDQTACYDLITRRMKEVCAGREFKLIEKLGWDLFQAVKEAPGPGSTLTLHVKKVSPPVEDLLGGAVFSMTEEPSW